MEGRARLETNPNEPLLHDIEVCGDVLCQFGGMDDFVPVYVQLGAGALSICADRAGGSLISTARVPDLSRLIVRKPRTARSGRPHCLRVDLADDEPDSRGMSKYIFDLGSAENLDKWKRGLTARYSESERAPVDSGSWWRDLKLNLNLDHDDELSRQVSLDLSPRARAMITHHKQAQLEVVHNSIVEAKRRAGVAASARRVGSSFGYAQGVDADWVCVEDDVAAYKKWLQCSMPQDYDNEFVACSRNNEALHEIWDATSATDALVHVYTEAATNHIDQYRVERMVKMEFSPLHELIQDADNLLVDGRTSDAEEMYGWLVDRLMDKLDAEPDPNKKQPLASKIRIIQGRMQSKRLSDAAQKGGQDSQGFLFRVMSNGKPAMAASAPAPAPPVFVEGMAVEFMTSTGEWRRGQVHSFRRQDENSIVTIMHDTNGIIGFKEVDANDPGAIRAIPEPEPEREPAMSEGVPPGTGAGLLNPTPKSRWQRDEECSRCPGVGCPAPVFKLTRRRHHCRGCGLVFCDRCSPETAIISAGLCAKSGVVGLEFGKPAPTITVSLVAGKLIFGRASSDGIVCKSPDETTGDISREFDVRGCRVERVQGRERTLRIIGAKGATAAGSSKVGNFVSRRGSIGDVDEVTIEPATDEELEEW